MGRSCGPALNCKRRRFASGVFRHAPRRSDAAVVAAAILFSALTATSVAQAQTTGSADASAQASPASAKTPDQSLLKADSIVYAKDTATALGHVQIYYQGRVLQADKVTFDRKANRVFAEGRAKLTEADGTVAYGSRFELTQDLKDGFIDAVQADTADQTHFSAARVERAEGNDTTFERGTYTACEPCKEHPERPPLWQVTAKKIVHDEAAKTIYYEDAELALAGVPILYLPYFSTPDPSVQRKTGLLAPRYSFKSQLGFGFSAPIFLNLAPNYDLTLTPTFYSRQGPMLDAQWRHRFTNGSYDVEASAISQFDSTAFDPAPFGAGNRTFRGNVRSTGEFDLNAFWKFGWNVSLSSDKFYTRDYGDSSQILASTFFGVNTSTAYLTGQGAQSWFDIRGYYFEALSADVLQRQQPIVTPVLNYDRTFELDPAETMGLGGQFQLSASFSHIDQAIADFQSTGAENLDQAFNLYSVCETNKIPNYTPGACLLRGVAGDYSHGQITASWQRKFIDPIGDVWTPFAFARVAATSLNLNLSQSVTFSSASGTSTISDSSQSALLGAGNRGFVSETTPGVGTEWRLPLIASGDWATQILEPIAQVIVRPSETPAAAQVNEDSQSLVFDDTNLFEWSKFSGTDRFEGGTRLNYGAQYALTFNNGGYFNALFGQSYQLAGANSYAMQDALAVGLGSGLNSRASDYVARIQAAPNSHFAVIAKANFDSQTWTPHRIDLSANAIYGNWEGSLNFARYVAQPSIGYYVTREGLSPSLKVKIADDFFVDGNVVFDLSRHYYNTQFGANAPLFSIAGLGVGAGYSNDCATISVNYTSVYQADLLGPAQRNQTVAVSLQLRTLGDTQIRSGLADLKVEDGLQAVR